MDFTVLADHRAKIIEKERINKYLNLKLRSVSLRSWKRDWVNKNQLIVIIIKEYLRRIRKLLEIKLYTSNLIKEINTWALPVVRYSGPFLKCTREELKQMYLRIKKPMTMHKALHPRDDVDRLYVSRREEGR